jgi:hypothetical protein
MNGVDLTSITRSCKSKYDRRLCFSAKWLADMGFVSGALVQYLPEHDGATFTLCDENIPKYSELFHRTKEKGGTLIQTYESRDGLQVCLSGSRLEDTGLVYGDKLIIRYEHGFVKMRKFPYSEIKLTTSHVIGKWIADSGFVPDAVLTVASEHGLITCTLHENGIARTPELVKYARENKLKLIQVQKEKNKYGITQWIDIPPSCLNQAGFLADDLLLAIYEYGEIKLQKPDFKALGF